jgi:hypothetical protein
VVISLPHMPTIFAALVAFVGEHQRCGEMDGGRGGYIWLVCSCARLSSLPQHWHERNPPIG